MSRKKMHSKMHLSYDGQTTGNVWVECKRHVPQDQIAAFREGVTCRNCLAILEFEEEWQREREARMLAKLAERNRKVEFDAASNSWTVNGLYCFETKERAIQFAQTEERI